MNISLPLVKVLKTDFEKLIISQELCSLLQQGNLYEFEQELHRALFSLYDKICEAAINFVSKTSGFVSAQKLKGEELGLKKLEFRKATLQLRTGTKINYDSLYAKVAPEEYNGSRHLSSLIWQSSLSCSPMYKSLSCLFSVLCPSFDVSKSLMNYQDIRANSDRIRQVSLSLADECIENRETIQLDKGETLAGKRVVIAMDGGRTRTRVYKEGKAGRAEKFDRPWREPKLFVITTLDEHGKPNKVDKPIYDVTFGDDEVFELLGKYLENLEIDKAESVQFLADGAPWIWDRVKLFLLNLGVAEDKIIETLDCYHAMEHLNAMKVYFDKDKQASHFKKLKEELWQGNFGEMTKLIKEGITNVDLENFNPFKYFRKQQNRIDYQSLKADNRPCGSGIIESGIRRIINLRFKSPSTFWYLENVEKLIFIRGVALSGRWEIMMKNKFYNQ
jgi:hypothetical protein